MPSFRHQKCEVCFFPSELTCSNCEKVFYCSLKHYKAEAKAHKRHCFPVDRIQTFKGPILQSTRVIQVGEVIFKEIPLFIGPGSYDFCFKLHSNPKLLVKPICLGCYQFLPQGTKLTCDTCGWPMHKNCQNEPWHKDFECSLLVNRSKFSETDCTQYYHISILRLLLLPKVLPSIWEKLESHVKVYGEEFLEPGLGRMKDLVNSVRTKFGLTFEVSGTLMGGVYKTLQYKGIFNVIPENVCCTCIFEKMSETRNSCLPNCRYTMVPYKAGQPFQILLYASMTIDSGEVITRNFIEEVTMQETFIRRDKLRMLCGSCTCQRCVDPSELGTFLSAVCCPCIACFTKASGEGYLLPMCPNEQSLEGQWKCTHCDFTITYAKMQHHVNFGFKKILSLKLTVCRSPLRRAWNECSCDDLRVYEVMLDGIETILEHFERLIHKNHYLLWPLNDAYMSLAAQALEVMPPSLKFYFSDKLISMAWKSLDIILSICPGISPTTGQLLYYLAKGLEALIQTAEELSQEHVKIRAMLDRLSGDSLSILSIIKRFPQSHGLPRANDMMTELQEIREELKYDGLNRLFEIEAKSEQD